MPRKRPMPHELMGEYREPLRPPVPPPVRFRIDPDYAPAEKVARKLCLTPEQFRSLIPQLFARGFPMPDETTGMYDLEAIDRWRKRRRPDLYPELTPGPAAPDTAPARKSMGDRFVEAKERRRHG
ncbi:hypothetical protein [Methylobacterium nodulans]|uniref:Uncharacterized protein n=1 Tax=Methylobacterium nodulans (strain LMG 21967 / CNCM I-2342 / ORS 2060) TaxID=460265 RepID=B8IE69_METNO|nr:hypothetical protein [Methylobacterium nodulans]ACL57615.1 hypothetical protein Mnod_2652 [Methylobacterium nodulans ORS 2060]